MEVKWSGGEVEVKCSGGEVEWRCAPAPSQLFMGVTRGEMLGRDLCPVKGEVHVGWSCLLEML